MTSSSFFLILRRQIQQKWGRFFLASGGIMIGIWAITLTTSLSLGLSDTIIQAINSQPGAKVFSLYKTDPPVSSFFQIREAPKFVAIGNEGIEEIKRQNPEIVGIVPTSLLNGYVVNEEYTELNQGLSCEELNALVFGSPISSNPQGIPARGNTGTTVEVSNEGNEQTSQSLGQDNPTTPSPNSTETSPEDRVTETNASESLQNPFQGLTSEQQVEELAKRCNPISFNSAIFQNFYESNRNNWIGKTTEPGSGEIVACFKCGSANFNESLGLENPEDLLNKTLTFEYSSVFLPYESGEVVDTTDSVIGTIPIPNGQTETVTVVAVIDDRDENAFIGNLNFYIGQEYFRKAEDLAEVEIPRERRGWTEFLVMVDSYQNLNSVIDNLTDDDFIAFSAVQLIIQGVQTVFGVLTAVLAGFGFIALVASIFGIINVMTISVLERKKEIGVLKSLGAKDRDIFSIFLIESGMLGVIGWLLGTLISVGMGLIISFVFQQFILNNEEYRENLESLNIAEFSPSFPWWLILGSLALALFFTVISGVYPAIRAARQNPVDVLRSE